MRVRAAQDVLDDGSVALVESDLEFEGLAVHCYEAGSAGRPIVFLHGSGAGAATMSNFRRVLGPLSADFRVLAADLVGFGRSGLKREQPYFDMDMWVRQLQMLMRHAGGEGVIAVGHSLSGPICLKAAARDRSVAAVVTTGTMGVAPEPPPDGSPAGPRWVVPETPEAVLAAVQRTFYDKSLAEPAEVERRLEVLNRPGYRQYYEAMFAGPASRYVGASAVTEEELAAVHCPVVLMHGAADASFAASQTSLRLAGKLANADAHVFARCAHSVAHERPIDFVALVRALALRLDAAEQSR